MTRLAALILLAVLVWLPFHLPAGRVDAQTPIPPGLSEQKIVAEHAGVACGTAPPTTVAGWRGLADAIVHVRMDSQVTYDHQINIDGTQTTDVITAHEATVLDVLKSAPRGTAVGSSMAILQRGGIIARQDGLHRYRWNRFDIMPAGTEWVLFLYWNNYVEGFEVLHFEDGAFQVDGGTVTTAGRAPFAERWRGQRATAFLAALAENGRA